MFIVRTNREIPGVNFLSFEGKPTDEELEAYLQSEATRLGTERPSPVVTVLSLGSVWTSTQRKRMREFEAEVQDKTSGTQLGLAMVVPNSLVRGAFTAYLWLARPTYPTAMVATPAEAHSFVVERLRTVSLPIPDAAEFRRVAESVWSGRVARPGQGMVPLTATDSARAS